MIPLKYNAGNLKARRVSTLMTILGIGIVIAVMLAMMALYNGVISQVASSGSKDLMLVMRDGVDAELSSRVTKEAVQIMRALPGIAKDSKGEPLVSPQVVILFKLPKKDNPKGTNVTVRGVTPNVFELRPYVTIVEGRMFTPGLNEMIVARRIRDRFVNTGVGDTFQFGPQKWTVVGVFDARGTAYDSEMWCDAGYLGQARKRDTYSSVLIKPADRAALESIKAAIVNDNRLKFQVRSERRYFEDQTRGLDGIKKLVEIVTFFMVGAAIFGTMNTMFSATASRGRELATLRAIGFRRRAVLLSMIVESAVIALLGGIAGVLMALPVNAISSGTMNPQTMSEVAFNFRVDTGIAGIAIAIALGAGVAGGLLPALNAARMPITKALREI
ncbi:MAG TPA: ABC transporter permease [Thermoanaerobaculia bacterium]|nr:ABC transporter permease [Thermoanaerobaculia bacterium]